MVGASRQAPIGIFDSGLGGLTVARSVIDVLPHESIVYYGDNARYPYGPRPAQQVHDFACEIIDHLLEQDVKLIVVGCNSASSALASLGRPEIPVPVVTVINPPAQTAVRLTRNRRVGVIGTQVTIDSGQYEQAINLTRRPVEVFSQACPDFVEFVERGETTGDAVMEAARGYLEPLKAQGVDTVILGCTHYPILQGTIQYVMGPDVLLVSSAEETAKDVFTVLVANDMLSEAAEPTYEFRTSGDELEFQRLGHRFLGPEISNVERHRLG